MKSNRRAQRMCMRAVEALENRCYLAVDDQYEPNNTFDTATSFGLLEGANAADHLACLNDDWYSFQMGKKGAANNYVSIDFQNSQGDLDLALYNSSGHLLRYSQTVSNEEKVSLSNLAAATYYIYVYGFNGATNPDYTLTIDTPVVTLQPDAYEPNDTLDQASDLGTVSGAKTIDSLTINTPTDQDLFKFTTVSQATSADYVQINFANAQGDLDLALYDDAGNLLGKSNGTSDSETISLDGFAAGTYVAQIYGYNGATNQYSLTLQTPATSIAPDAYEPNDTLNTATDLGALSGPSSLPNLSIHSTTDVDYYKLTLGAAGTAANYVQIDFSDAAGDLDMQLLDSQGNVLATSNGTSDSERVSLNLPAGTYYVGVYGYNGATNTYAMTINAPVSGPVQPDAYEGQEPIHLNQNQTVTGLSIHDPAQNGGAGTRADTFTFTTLAAGGNSDFVSISYAASQGLLKIMLQDANHNTLRTVAGAGGDQLISLAGLAKGTYFVVVDSQNGGTNPNYSLTINAAFQNTATLPLWTVLVYMDGDNNLEQNAIYNLNQMEAAATNRDIQWGVELDRIPGYDSSNGNWTDTRRGIVRHDTDMQTISSALTSVGEKDMSSPQTLSDFINWGVATLPAQHYALVIWDHGAAIYGACYDDTTGNGVGMSLPAMGQVLAGSPAHISVLGFDACMMATTEVLNAVAPSVDYLAASEETEGADGWNYTKLAQDLSGMTDARSFASTITQSGRTNSELSTFSTVQANGNTLDAAITGFVSAVLNTATSADFTNLDAARAASASYDYSFMHDLGSFMQNVKTYVSNASIKTAADAVLVALGNSVVNNYSTADKGGTGLTIYLPAPEDTIESTYANLTFAQQTGWLQYLQAVRNRFSPASRTVGPRDWAESNDVRSQATDLHTLAAHGMTFSNLSINTPTDVDWFRFTTTAAGTPADQASISFSNATGNLDLYLYDSQGNLLTSSTGTGDSESVSLSGQPAGDYYLKVASANGNTNPDYTLTVDAPSPPSGTGDWAEPNDTREKAFTLPVGTPEGGLTLTVGDVDWYHFQVDRLPALNPLVVTATYDAGGGSLQMTLYDTAGNAVAHSSAVTGGQALSYPSFTGQEYLLQVTGSPAGTDLPYSILATHDFSQTLAVDTDPPSARLTPLVAPKSGGTGTNIYVTYTDPSGVSTGTIGAGDVRVIGPRRFSQYAKYISKTVTGNKIVAHYTITAPGGRWDATDAGTYTVQLMAGQVKDNAGNANRYAVLGTFKAFTKTAPKSAPVAQPAALTWPRQRVGWALPTISTPGTPWWAVPAPRNLRTLFSDAPVVPPLLG
ncbi:MAG: clostripain-related cysteine peptidase [Tepidisphaerales bacterium]